MMLTYHNLDIEIQTEGIISIDSLHIMQRLNDHGKAMIRAAVEEERAIETVEQAAGSLSVHIRRRDEKKHTLFCGKIEEIKAEKERGLFYLCMHFTGYTREWDLTDKSQSFCRGNETYAQVLSKALSEYGKAQIKDEATNGMRIPGMLMQYEETDWNFLKRLASHFSTFILADNTVQWGRAYFGIPHMDHGTVLEEEEYTLLKGMEHYERSDHAADILPQERMRWRLRSRRHMQFGEQVALGHIETVVTAVDIKTVRGELVYEYELSRRKGIFTDRKTNPRIFGMSIPATVKERKGNQVRVQLDIDASYEPAQDLKWFTYAIETSNFYCMPEEGSRVHIYFPDHEEQSAMAVHALRMGRKSGSRTAGEGDQGGRTGSGSAPCAGNEDAIADSTGNAGNTVPAGSGMSSGESASLGGAPGTAAAMGTAAPQPEAEEPEAGEKNPDYKVFSDPSGSYMELAPSGITFSPGGGAASMVLQGTGTLSLTGLSINFYSGRNNIFVGLGNPGNVETVDMSAADSIRMVLMNGDSRITISEEIDILAAFVRKDAELKNPALPPASLVRASLTAMDARNRAARNLNPQNALTNAALNYKMQLEAKEAAAKSKIAEGVVTVVGVVACVAVIAATGGAATPVVAGIIAATGSFATVSGISDISEGVSDLDKVEDGDLSRSLNMMRDGLFGGNEAAYEVAKSVNIMVFSVVSCKTVRLNLASAENAAAVSKLVATLQKADNFRKQHQTALKILNCAQDFASACYEDYQYTGSLDAKNVVVNMGASALKGAAMNTLRFGDEDPNLYLDIMRKISNGFIGAGAGMAIDDTKCDLTGYNYDPVESFQQNMRMSTFNECIADPLDAVSGSFLLTETDLFLPDVREPIRLERSYSSTRQAAGWLGKGWHFAYEGRLYEDGDIIHGQLPDGFCVAFRRAGEEFKDILGNGRYALRRETGQAEWVVADRHQHKAYSYTGEGLLAAVTDRNGQSLVLSYEDGLLCRMQTAFGYTVDFRFRDGKLSSMQDDMGRSLEYRYTEGMLTEVVHMDGGVTKYQYSEEGYLTRPIDQTGLGYLVNKYDGMGRVTSQRLANGEEYRMTYHDGERKVCMEYSACPGERQYFYNEEHAISMVAYPDGSRKSFAYDGKGNRIRETDRLGRSICRQYDDCGRLIREIMPEGLETGYTYDRAGDLVSVRDNGGREKLSVYDARHNLIIRKEKTAEGHYIEESYSYDHMGRLISQSDGEGHVTAYRYREDSVYPSVTVYGDGSELECEYSRDGRRLAEDDGAVRWEYAYNRGGYRTMERDGEGNETHFLYDGMGRKLAMYTPRQWKEKTGGRTDYRYDFMDRLTDTVHPDGSHERVLWDGEGNIRKKVHPNAYDERTKDGEGTVYDYDLDNRLIRIHHPDGGVERLSYDGAGNRTGHVLPEQYEESSDAGAGWTYGYDEGNRLVSVTGPDGVLEHTYAYDLWGNCICRTDGKGCSIYYAYDLAGRLIRELAPAGEEAGNVSYRMTSYSYDDSGNRIKEVRHGGRYGAEGQLLAEGEDLTLTFAYDARNRLVRVEDGLGAGVSYRYDARGNRTSEEQVVRSGGGAAGRRVLKKIRYSYDRAGRLIKKTELLDDGFSGGMQEPPVKAVTGYAYDEDGNLAAVTTPEGYRISRKHDGRGRITEECMEDKENGIRRTTRIAYDKAGNILSVRQEGKDGQAREISYGYDLKDRLVHAAELDGPVFGFSYDRNDRKAGEDYLLPAEAESYARREFRYDVRGNLLEYYGDGILLEQNRYDARGNRLSRADGDGVEISCRYGIQDEQTELYTAGSRKQGKAAQRLVHDARGRITGVEDGCGGKTRYELDGWGRILSVRNAEGGREEYAYDQAGNITETVDARGGKICYAYNSQGKACAITDQGGNTETFRYDREGRQIQHTDRRGIVTETKYNMYGQPVRRTCTDGKGKRHVMGTWEYDDFGQLKKSVAGGSCYTYAYRPDGKLLEKRSSGKRMVSCAYYKDGTLKSLTDVSGRTVHYGYDGNGRLASLADEGKGVLAEYRYTAAGRLREIRTQEGFCASYGYDADGNLSRLRIGNEENGALLYDAFMAYDLNGNRTGRTGERLGADGKRREMHAAYSYDHMNRLTEERRETDGDRYSYDLAGNRTRRQRYHYAQAAEKNRGMQSQTGTIGNNTCVGECDIIEWEENYRYNGKNQLTEKKSLSGITEYVYDGNGNLTSEKEGGKTTSYRYDLLNRQEKVWTSDGREQENLYDGEGLRAGLRENGKESSFLFYNGEILTECDGDGVPVRRHLLGMGLSHMQTLDDGMYHACYQDEQGSTAFITGDGGEVENSYVYDAFGNVLERKEGIRNDILYRGQKYDQEAGQYYLRARYYNPVIGRFIQEDTYRGDGLNLYAYCGNNPVMYYDPSGHTKVTQPITEPEVPRTAGEGDFITSFRDMMTSEEAARYDDYWKQGAGSYKNITENGKTWEIIISNGDTINTRQRLQTNPGTRSIVDIKYGSNGEMYYRETIFDQFGRRIGNNDFTDHGMPGIASHTNPHYHPNSPLDPQAHGDGIPGIHPDTP